MFAGSVSPLTVFSVGEDELKLGRDDDALDE